MATNKSILDTQESTTKLNPNADQVTLEKSVPLASLQPPEPGRPAPYLVHSWSGGFRARNCLH